MKIKYEEMQLGYVGILHSSLKEKVLKIREAGLDCDIKSRYGTERRSDIKRIEIQKCKFMFGPYKSPPSQFASPFAYTVLGPKIGQFS